jgi:dUTP pyrophosphatase
MFNRLKIRGFEVAKPFLESDVRLPERATEHSAGYDFFAAKAVLIDAGEMGVVATGVKAYMKEGEVLILADRSSNSKRGIFLSNSIGVIDGDYYNNEENDGHIMFKFKTDRPVIISKGDKIGQGIFTTFLTADHGNTNKKRSGGFGSTDAD